MSRQASARQYTVLYIMHMCVEKPIVSDPPYLREGKGRISRDELASSRANMAIGS